MQLDSRRIIEKAFERKMPWNGGHSWLEIQLEKKITTKLNLDQEILIMKKIPNWIGFRLCPTQGPCGNCVHNSLAPFKQWNNKIVVVSWMKNHTNNFFKGKPRTRWIWEGREVLKKVAWASWWNLDKHFRAAESADSCGA